MSRSERCVYTANNVAEADIISAWLSDQDIDAMVPDRHAIGATTFGLPAMVPGGIEVCVKEATHLTRAQELLREHAEHIESQLAGARAATSITVKCDECGESTDVPCHDAGTVISCANCKAYIDVPDPDHVRPIDDANLDLSAEPPE